MKAKSTRIEDIEEIILPWGRGFPSTWKKGEVLTIRTDSFETTIYEKGIKISYTIFRNHDHNNSPSIFFELPEEGSVDDFGKNAKLTVQSDSRHLSLDMRYNDYVWERGLELVVKKYEYETLKNIFNNKGLDALLSHLGIVVSRVSKEEK